AGEPGRAANDSIDEPDRAIRDDAGARHRGEARAEQIPQAEQDEDRADGETQIAGTRPAQELSADRHADDAADQKRHEAFPLDRAAQLPYRDALHDEAERDDQGRRLRRRHKMQPDRGCDDREGKTGKPGDKRGGKGPGEKQRKIERMKLVHGIPHAGPPGLWRDGGWGNAWPTEVARGRFHGLHSSSGMPRVEVNRTLCNVLALADAVTFAYLSRDGVVQAPRQTADR